MVLSKNTHLLFVLVWITFFAWTTVSESCYFPDGIQATDNTPCYQNGSVSACCGPGFTCLTNGLCQQGQNLFRGTCTDSTWKSDNCPDFCTSGKQLDNWMSSCPSLGSGYFCCGSDNSCCGNSTLILLLGSGTVITKTSSTSTSTSASTSASASASTSVSTTSVPTTKTTTTIFNQSTSAIATNQTTTTSNIQHSVQVDDNNGSGTNVAIAAGVGAGVGIPVCIGIAGLIFFCRRRRRQAAIDEAFYKSRSEKLPPCELELNAPRSEMASTALCELPATRG